MKTIVLMVLNWYRLKKYQFKAVFQKKTPWCENCKEKDCLIDTDDTCAMVRVYLKAKNELL